VAKVKFPIKLTFVCEMGDMFDQKQ
jgi:hypothetical protein